MRSLLTSALVFGSLLGATTAAFATPTSVSVTYSASDLTTEAGSAAVYEKIAAAAKTVCRPESIMPLAQSVAFQAKVDAPALSAYHEAVLHPSRNAVTKSATLASR
jgi:UrcA family protein